VRLIGYACVHSLKVYEQMSTYYEILCEYYEHPTKTNKAPLAVFVCGLERCMGMGVRRQRLLSRVLLCVLCGRTA
jgi:hypothetical protein